MEYILKFNNKREIEELKTVLSDFCNYSAFNISKKYIKRLDKLLNKKPIKISSRKAKGRNLQKYVCEKLAEIFDIQYNQQDDTCPIHSREMGQSGTDIVIRNKELLRKFPYAVECKNTEKISINEMIKQAESHLEKDADKYENWLVFYKNNKLGYPVVILDIFEFFKLFKRSLNGKIIKLCKR